MRALHSEFVRCADEGETRKLGNFGSSCLGKTGRGVDPGADCSAAEGQAIYSLECVLDSFEIICQHAGVARHSWPKVIGVASCICVRPILTTSSHSFALVAIAA